MGSKEARYGRDDEHMEDLQSASLMPNKECHQCSSAAKSSLPRHLFKTIVLVALAYICILETNTRLAVQSHETYIHPADDLPYCKHTVVF